MFKILLNNPRVVKKELTEKYESIGELIESIFPFSDDCLYINWNHIDIQISYKYDLSIIFEDFVYIYNFLESHEEKLRISFPSNTFDVEWDIKKDGNHIDILSQWNTVLSHNEKILNENSLLKTDINTFTKELSKLLSFIYKIIIDEADNVDTLVLSDILKSKPINLLI